MAHVVLIIFFPISISFMSHVDFKKWPCRPVESKGQGLSYIRVYCATSEVQKLFFYMTFGLSNLVKWTFGLEVFLKQIKYR